MNKEVSCADIQGHDEVNCFPFHKCFLWKKQGLTKLWSPILVSLQKQKTSGLPANGWSGRSPLHRPRTAQGRTWEAKLLISWQGPGTLPGTEPCLETAVPTVQPLGLPAVTTALLSEPRPTTSFFLLSLLFPSLPSPLFAVSSSLSLSSFI